MNIFKVVWDRKGLKVEKMIKRHVQVVFSNGNYQRIVMILRVINKFYLLYCAFVCSYFVFCFFLFLLDPANLSVLEKVKLFALKNDVYLKVDNRDRIARRRTQPITFNEVQNALFPLGVLL